MLDKLFFQVELFIFIMAIFVILIDFIHIISVFRMRSGKAFNHPLDSFMFLASIAYIITILISGF